MKKIYFWGLIICSLLSSGNNLFAQCGFTGWDPVSQAWPTMPVWSGSQQSMTGQGMGSGKYYYCGNSGIGGSWIQVFNQPQAGTQTCSQYQFYYGGDIGPVTNNNNTWGIVQAPANVDYIKVTTTNGGWNTTSTILYYMYMTPATPAFSGGVTTACTSSGNQTYSIGGVSYATSYVWSVSGAGASIVSGQGSTSIVVNYSTGGTASINVYATNNGKTNSGTVTRTCAVETPPTITSATAASNNICTGTTTALTANGIGGTNASLTWWTSTAGGGTSYGSANPVNVYPGQTFYARITNNYCAAAEASVTINTETTAPTITPSSGISVYTVPNQSCKGVASTAFATMPTAADNCATGSFIQPNILPASGLLNWYKADAGLVTDGSSFVTRWKDVSGNGNDMIQTTVANKPSKVSSGINNLPTVRFTTSQFLQQVSGTGTGATYSIFTVSRTTGTSLRLISSATQNWLLGYWNGFSNQHYANNWVSNTGACANQAQTASNTLTHMYAATYTPGGTTNFYDNGVLLYSNTCGTISPDRLQFNGYNGANELSAGDISEVIVYNRVLTTAERQIVEGYLANKYSLNAPLASMQAAQLFSNGATFNFHAADQAGNRATSSETVSATSFPGPTPVVTTAGNSCGNTSATLAIDGMAPAGQYLNASGTGDYLEATNNIVIGSNWTIETWFKSAGGSTPLPATGSWNTFIRGTALHHIIVSQPSWMLGVFTGAGFISSGYDMRNTSAGWHHMAAVGTGGTTKFYIDGVYVGTSLGQCTDNIVAIGNFQGGGQQAGQLDEVRIWNTTLTQNRIAQYMTQTITASHSNWANLVSYYKMNGNGNDSKGSSPGTLRGSATLSALTAYYTYVWSGPGGTFSNNNTTLETTVVSNPAVGNPSVYSCVATANSCSSAAGNVNVTVYAVPLAPNVATTSVTGCGQATIYASAGTNGTTCRFYGPNSTTTLAGSGTSLNILSVGTFTYYVSSYNASTTCEGPQTAVSVTVSPTFTLTSSNPNSASYGGYGVKCYGATNGAVLATATSTNYPISYVWSTGTTNSVSSSTNTLSSLAAGNYEVTVTDAGGCVNSTSFTLTTPTQVTASLVLAPGNIYNGFGENCNGASVGAINSTPSGGNGTYTYSWSSTPTGYSSASQNITGLSARTYNVTVTDANLCPATASISVTEPQVISFTTSVGYACSGSTYTSGSISVNATGGATSTYQYNFGFGWQSSNTLAGLGQGNYNVQVRDNSYTGCVSGTVSTNITFPPAGTSVGDCNFIYVSTGGDPSGTLGTKNCPASLSAAFAIFASNPSRNQILMQQGNYTYSSTLSIPANITIDGGYDGNWIKSSAASATTLNITPPETNNGTVAHYIGIQPSGNNFVLKDLTINVLTGGASGTYNSRGKSVYGIYTNGITGYTISRCRITTGPGSAGGNGSTPSGTGGGFSGGGGGSQGGWGGRGCNNCGSGGGGGGNGAGPSGGSAGAGGGRGCANGCNIFGCDASGGNAGSGNFGSQGGVGAAPSGTPSASAGLGVFYSPVTGSQGNSGSGGGGGGGGGGGAGGSCCTCSCGGNSPPGGAGGAGGNGGAGGFGGFGGGGSFAVYAYGGSGSVIDCSLNAGAGGNGGTGGTGQAANGGSGGGGGGCGGGCSGGCSGSGGNGGAGGQGGQGQTGATGLSQGFYSTGGVTQSGSTSVPNDGVVTANWTRGCTKSQIDLVKNSSSSWTNISSDPAFVNNLTSSTTSYTGSSNSISIYYPASSATGDKDLSLGSTTLQNFIKINGARLVDPASSIFNSITPPCPSASITLGTNLNSTQLANIIGWTWEVALVSNPTNVVYSSTAANPGVVNAPSGGWVPNGVYQVKLRMQENCCGWSIPVYTTFTALAVPPTAGAIGGLNSVCANTNNVFYSISLVPTATTYQWTVTGGSITSAQGTNFITVNWGGAGTGVVSVVPSNACGNTPAPTTLNVTINALPTVSITPNPASGASCSGGTVVLTSGASAGGGGNGTFTYAWSTGEGTPNITKNPTTNTTYTVSIIEGISGCTASNSVVIAVSPQPTVSISGGNSVCPNGTVSLTSTSAGGIGALDFQWQSSTNNVSFANVTGANSATFNPPTATAGTIYYRLQVSNSGSSCNTVASASETVEVYAAPSVAIGSNSPVCEDGTLSLTVPGGSAIYDWSGPNGFTSASQNPSISNVTLAAGGTYTLLATTSNNCTATASTSVTVNPLPAQVVVNPATPFYVAPGPATQLTATAAGASTITWSPGTGLSATTGSTVFASPATNTTYDVVATTALGCSTTVQVTVLVVSCPTDYWFGTVDNDWFNPNNWSCGVVPNPATNVTIPAAATNYPEISGAPLHAPATVHNLEIEAGASVNVLGTNNVTLDVYGHFTNTNTAATSIGAGKVNFKGTTSQIIDGATQFNNVDVANSSGIVIAPTGSMMIGGVMNLNSGVVTTNGNLTLTSTNTGKTGLIDDFTSGRNGSISGNIHVERYVVNPDAAFYFIGTPVGSATMAQWAAEFDMSPWNNATDGSQVRPTWNCDQTALESASPYGGLFDYRENTVTYCNFQGWHVRLSGGIAPGKGYAGRVPDGTMLSLFGSYTTGNVSSPALTKTTTNPVTQGFNLISNPYASPIEWNDVATANPGITGTAYMYINTGTLAGTYAPVNQITGGGQIASSEAFYVLANVNNTTISFNNSMRRVGANQFLRTTPVWEQMVTLNMSGNGHNDVARVAFGKNFTSTFDRDYDAKKLQNKGGQPSIFVTENSDEYAIYAIPSPQEVKSVPVSFKAGTNGKFSINADVSNFEPTALVFLEDLKLNVMHNLLANPNYSFSADVNDNAARFVLHFVPAATTTAADVTCKGKDGQIQVNLGNYQVHNTSLVWDAYKLTDATGKTVSQGNQVNGNLVLSNLESSVYNLDLSIGTYTASQHLSVAGVTPVNAAFVAPTNVAQPNTAVQFKNSSIGATRYEWTFGDGSTANVANPDHTFLAAGEYTVVLTALNADCAETYTTQMKVGVTDVAEKAAINVFGYRSQVFINFNNYPDETVKVNIYDIMGRKLIETRTVDAKNGKRTIQLTNVISGYYFVEVIGSKAVTQKVYLSSDR